MENKLLKTHSQRVIECRQRRNDLIQLSVPKGYRTIINERAKSNGETTNEYIRRLISQDLGIPLPPSL